jgi:hypothetical protein
MKKGQQAKHEAELKKDTKASKRLSLRKLGVFKKHYLK